MPIITTNQISATNNGITFTGANKTYTIVPNVIVAGSSRFRRCVFETVDFNGVYSNFANSILANHGIVLADENIAVYFDVNAGR